VALGDGSRERDDEAQAVLQVVELGL